MAHKFTSVTLPGAISTTPFYNPCSNQGVALVSDAIAYTFDNPDAFPIVSGALFNIVRP